ncbi:RWD domain-containing protein 1-like [Trifolium pratense]|uniref:RWD domain-containing protein 1-like n=1 Tax=Trifolium pratense TaxID=57577 RepID=A0A2K3MPB0_TRIPR|nr:RWD domain-containing protein 1-like [Trifolium pratense]
MAILNTILALVVIQIERILNGHFEYNVSTFVYMHLHFHAAQWLMGMELKASENLGMAMIYTLVNSAKEWLTERFTEDSDGDAEAEEAAKEDIVIPHGEPVTVETFLAWRERFEAELALERAKLMPESVLATPKEKKLSGRQWFESGRMKGAAIVTEELDEDDEEDIDFDDDEDFEDDEDDMLEHYLAEKSDSSTHSSLRAS